MRATLQNCDVESKGMNWSCTRTNRVHPLRNPSHDNFPLNVLNDQLFFDIGNVAQQINRSRPTKRNAVSLATRFYDLFAIISPITVRFKQLFQKLCERKLDWDERLIGEILTEWEGLASDLRQFPPIKMPRHQISMTARFL